MIGPSRKLQCGPPAFWSRSRANVRRSAHRARISCSCAMRSGRALTGSNNGASMGGSRARCAESGYPTRRCRNRRSQLRVVARRSWQRSCRSSSRVSATPTPARTRGPSASPRRRSSSSPSAPASACALNSVRPVGLALANLDLIQILNVLVLLYRIAAAIDAYRVAGYLNGARDERRPARQAAPGDRSRCRSPGWWPSSS